MIINLGYFLLILAFVMSSIQALLPIIGVYWKNNLWSQSARPMAILIFWLVFLSFASLLYSYIISDFSVRNVAENSNSFKPLFYKISALWSNHEGSMLLWVLLLSGFGFVLAVNQPRQIPQLESVVLSVLAWILACFIFYILYLSNPFLHIWPIPIEGSGLNPLLQDVGLAVHPPLLYIGYVGSSVVFCFAVAGLLLQEIDKQWAKKLQLWVLISWIFLTLGIVTGSYWAYYELGWGGSWYWDPVENAALIPWLSLTALLHSARVTNRSGDLKIWTVLLSILTFSFSMIGTFLVRSGVLISVHSFVQDSQRGLFILFILSLLVGLGLLIFAWRAPSLKSKMSFQPLSREGAIIFNNVFLLTAASTVLLGTLYPMLLWIIAGEQVFIGAPFFNLTFTPLIIPLLFMAPLAVFFKWQQTDLKPIIERMIFLFVLCLSSILWLNYKTAWQSLGLVLGLGLSIWVIGGSFVYLWSFGSKHQKMILKLNHLRQLPFSAYAVALAHGGLGICLLGILASNGFAQQAQYQLQPGQSVDFVHYQITLKNIEQKVQAGEQNIIATFTVQKGQNPPNSVQLIRHFFVQPKIAKFETALFTTGLSQIYFAPGADFNTQKIIVQLYWKPWVLCIWFGPLLMAFGGVLSLLGRVKYREQHHKSKDI